MSKTELDIRIAAMIGLFEREQTKEESEDKDRRLDLLSKQLIELLELMLAEDLRTPYDQRYRSRKFWHPSILPLFNKMIEQTSNAMENPTERLDWLGFHIEMLTRKVASTPQLTENTQQSPKPKSKMTSIIPEHGLPSAISSLGNQIAILVQQVNQLIKTQGAEKNPQIIAYLRDLHKRERQLKNQLKQTDSYQLIKAEYALKLHTRTEGEAILLRALWELMADTSITSTKQEIPLELPMTEHPHNLADSVAKGEDRQQQENGLKQQLVKNENEKQSLQQLVKNEQDALKEIDAKLANVEKSLNEVSKNPQIQKQITSFSKQLSELYDQKQQLSVSIQESTSKLFRVTKLINDNKAALEQLSTPLASNKQSQRK